MGYKDNFLKTTKWIINDGEFLSANTIWKNVASKTKEAAKGNTQRYAEIEPEDLKKLCASFDLDDPSGLQDKLFSDIAFHLIRR